MKRKFDRTSDLRQMATTLYGEKNSWINLNLVGFISMCAGFMQEFDMQIQGVFKD